MPSTSGSEDTEGDGVGSGKSEGLLDGLDVGLGEEVELELWLTEIVPGPSCFQV